MRNTDGSPQGIDLKPFGWEALREQYHLPPRQKLFIRIPPRAMLVTQTEEQISPSGKKEEIFALSFNMSMHGDTLGIDSYRVVDGVLTEATPIIKDKADSPPTVTKVIEGRIMANQTGISLPSLDDMDALLVLMCRAADEGEVLNLGL